MTLSNIFCLAGFQHEPIVNEFSIEISRTIQLLPIETLMELVGPIVAQKYNLELRRFFIFCANFKKNSSTKPFILNHCLLIALTMFVRVSERDVFSANCTQFAVECDWNSRILQNVQSKGFCEKIDGFFGRNLILSTMLRWKFCCRLSFLPFFWGFHGNTSKIYNVGKIWWITSVFFRKKMFSIFQKLSL